MNGLKEVGAADPRDNANTIFGYGNDKLSRLDYFAAAALPAVIATTYTHLRGRNSDLWYALCVKDAFEFAQAMVEVSEMAQSDDA